MGGEKTSASLKENKISGEEMRKAKALEKSPCKSAYSIRILRVKDEYKPKFLFDCLSIHSENKRTSSSRYNFDASFSLEIFVIAIIYFAVGYIYSS